MSHKPSPFTYDHDERLDHGNVMWYYKHDDGHMIGVKNARPEYNEVDGSSIEWDGVTLDGREMTDEERDEYLDDLRDILRHEDWSN